jgi:hypothetical protein
MQAKLSLESILGPSENVVSRDIEGELLLVPLAAGMGDLDDELFTFNETGRSFWQALDGRRTLAEVVSLLAEEYDDEGGRMQEDVMGLAEELLRRRMIVDLSPR